MHDYTQRCATAAAMALTGGLIWAASGPPGGITLPMWQEVRVVTAGAGLGGWIAMPLFRSSAFSAALAGVVATALGAAFSATVLGMAELGWPEGLIGLLLGPPVVATTVFGDPVCGGIWVLGVVAAQLWRDAVRPGNCGFP